MTRNQDSNEARRYNVSGLLKRVRRLIKKQLPPDVLSKLEPFRVKASSTTEAQTSGTSKKKEALLPEANASQASIQRCTRAVVETAGGASDTGCRPGCRRK